MITSITSAFVTEDFECNCELRESRIIARYAADVLICGTIGGRLHLSNDLCNVRVQ